MRRVNTVGAFHVPLVKAKLERDVVRIPHQVSPAAPAPRMTDRALWGRLACAKV